MKKKEPEHVSIRELAQEYGRNASAVLDRLVSQRFADLGVTGAVAAELGAQWQAEDEQRTAAEVARQRAAAEKQERERLFREGEALLQELDRRRLDLEFTANQIEKTSLDTALVALEARQEVEVEDALAANAAWCAWKSANEALAAALLAARERGVAELAPAGPWKPPPVNWAEEGVFG